MVVLILSGFSANASPGRTCMTSREFITTLEFLRDFKELAIQEQDAQAAARKVAEHCTGAAQRFIRVAKTLSRAGLSGKNSVESGLEFASRTDRETETFLLVFSRAFLAEFLDLDLRSAMQMARSLSTQFDGDVLAVRDDFETVLEFCLRSKGLDLPRPRCGTLAAQLARKGGDYSGGISRPFIKLYQFLESERGPALDKEKSLTLAQELVAEGGADSADNFIHAYRYAISKSGLELSAKDAMGFARSMTVRGGKSESKKN